RPTLPTFSSSSFSALFHCRRPDARIGSRAGGSDGGGDADASADLMLLQASRWLQRIMRAELPSRSASSSVSCRVI
ncbi:unnamed protein product, partial [Musa banksii]